LEQKSAESGLKTARFESRALESGAARRASSSKSALHL
jgi:hypothetical protein